MTDSAEDLARDEFKKRLEQLMTDMAGQDAWTRFNALMREAATAEYPYWVSSYAPVALDDLMVESFAASRLYQIWAALGDRSELEFDERAEAEEDMKLAAQEWLALPDDPAAVRTYLEHWYCDVCGYDRQT